MRIKMNNKLPLAGVKVLDLGWWVVWPLAARLLAEFGAEVVRVEYSANMPERRLGPFKDDIQGPTRGTWWNKCNATKNGITLNFQKTGALQVAKRLVAWADVVGEGYTPGVVNRWGLDYEACREINPDIIYVSSSGQGQTGPDARAPSLGHAVLSLSAMSHFTGWPDRAPVGPYGAWTDFYVPYCVVLVVLAALVRRRKTGKGVHIDMANTEAALYGTFEAATIDYLVNGREQTRQGNRHPHAAPHSTYSCQGEERWCSIAVFTDEEWRGFCQAIGEPQWTSDPKFSTMTGRKRNEEKLDRLVKKWTKNFTAEEVMTRMQAHGVAAGVVENLKDLYDDTQLKHRKHFFWLEYPDGGHMAHSRHAFKFSKTAPQPRPAPAPGEHNEYVLKNLLGMSDDEIIELVMSGAFE